MSGDPTNICRTPEHIIVAMIEYPLKSFLHEHVVGSRGVLDALGFPRRTARIQNEQRCLTVHRSGSALRRRLLHQLVPPKITPGLHLNFRGAARSAAAAAAIDHTLLHR